MTIQWLQKYSKNSAVVQAYKFAEEAHKNTKRKSGDPYIEHCLEVAKTVNGWGMDEESIAAALLHDVVEDTGFTLKDIEKRFGKEIAFLVDGLTKLKKIKPPNKDANTETIKKLILSFSRDLRVVIIKLADRLHNMQTLKFLSSEHRKKISWETMEIYAPLAYRLGMQRLSGDLQDLAFPYLYPDEHQWLLDNVGEKYHEREEYAKKVKPKIRKVLEDHNINILYIDSRAKHYSSLYKKLQRYDMDLDKIYDLVALRIVVENVEECYTALGIIHKIWPPLPGRIKDYIARPKPNGYRSLHTTIFCLDNKITEFQIRTKEMHEEAEFGIAAHWVYQQVKPSLGSESTLQKWWDIMERKELLWVKQLRDWQKYFSTQKEFIESLKVDFFKDRVFVITPENDVLDFPYGVTPVDFAYHIHSEVGNQCVGAKVNGKITPLDYELHSGDIVEILTQKGKKPSEDWLRFVATSLARDHIRKGLRKKHFALRRAMGPTEIEFRITNEDHSGYLKDVASAFADLKINIIYFQSQTDERMKFSSVVVRCPTLPHVRLQKLLVKLKNVPGTREIKQKARN